MKRTSLTSAAVAVLLVGLSMSGTWGAEDGDRVDEEFALRASEIAFAKTMADRDLTAFSQFLSEETVFSGNEVHRGRAAVISAWTSFFEGDTAPFSWEPENVVVLESGRLGTSSGPVFDPDGKRIGTFNSVWRLESDGAWKVVFDRGCPPCECP